MYWTMLLYSDRCLFTLFVLDHAVIQWPFSLHTVRIGPCCYTVTVLSAQCSAAPLVVWHVQYYWRHWGWHFDVSADDQRRSVIDFAVMMTGQIFVRTSKKLLLGPIVLWPETRGCKKAGFNISELHNSHSNGYRIKRILINMYRVSVSLRDDNLGVGWWYQFDIITLEPWHMTRENKSILIGVVGEEVLLFLPPQLFHECWTML